MPEALIITKNLHFYSVISKLYKNKNDNYKLSKFFTFNQFKKYIKKINNLAIENINAEIIVLKDPILSLYIEELLEIYGKDVQIFFVERSFYEIFSSLKAVFKKTVNKKFNFIVIKFFMYYFLFFKNIFLIKKIKKLRDKFYKNIRLINYNQITNIDVLNDKLFDYRIITKKKSAQEFLKPNNPKITSTDDPYYSTYYDSEKIHKISKKNNLNIIEKLLIRIFLT